VEGWLPPEAPGHEPELAPPPAPVTSQGFAAPAQSQPQAPSQPQPQARPQPQPGQPYTPIPQNNDAIAGFVLGVSSIAALVVFVGAAWPLTLISSIIGIIFARKGKKAIAEHGPRKNDGLAQAGFIISIVAVVLSLLALAGCAAVIANGDLDHLDDHDQNDGPAGGLNSVVTLFRALVL
jgi:hypothetical protein